MQNRQITLIQSSITNGRIYFPINDAKFFPPDAFGDREGNGLQGKEVLFIAGDFRIETDIRISSGQRLSPRRTFAPYLKSIQATAGDRLLFKRISEREYRVERS